LQDAHIAVIGDSYIESPMIQYSDLVTTRLSQLANKPVANLGQSGYGPQQELVVLQRYALSLHPKIVVWAFFEGNDLAEARTYSERAAMIRERNAFDSAWERSFTKGMFDALLSAPECVPHKD
jgi:hypothetical protein